MIETSGLVDGTAPFEAAAASVTSTHWADLVAGLVRQEIDQGRLVRVSLPGASVPIPVEDASRWADMLVLVDPQGGRYYAADPAGVVVIAEPIKAPPAGQVLYWQQVDG
jgi:hypothetical protein